MPGMSPSPAVVSYTTVSPLPKLAQLQRRQPLGQQHSGGLFSVALSLSLPTVAVSHHPALWCPDFPQSSRLATVYLAPGLCCQLRRILTPIH